MPCPRKSATTVNKIQPTCHVPINTIILKIPPTEAQACNDDHVLQVRTKRPTWSRLFNGYENIATKNSPKKFNLAGQNMTIREVMGSPCWGRALQNANRSNIRWYKFKIFPRYLKDSERLWVNDQPTFWSRKSNPDAEERNCARSYYWAALWSCAGCPTTAALICNAQIARPRRARSTVALRSTGHALLASIPVTPAYIYIYISLYILYSHNFPCYPLVCISHQML